MASPRLRSRSCELGPACLFGRSRAATGDVPGDLRAPHIYEMSSPRMAGPRKLTALPRKPVAHNFGLISQPIIGYFRVLWPLVFLGASGSLCSKCPAASSLCSYLLLRAGTNPSKVSYSLCRGSTVEDSRRLTEPEDGRSTWAAP